MFALLISTSEVKTPFKGRRHLVWMLEGLGVLESKGFQVFPTIQGDLWKMARK